MHGSSTKNTEKSSRCASMGMIVCERDGKVGTCQWEGKSFAAADITYIIL